MSAARRPDALSRGAAAALGAGRLLIGAGIWVAPGPALRILGFDAHAPGARTLAHLAASRDLALGALTFAALEDRGALRRVALAAALADAGDSLAFALAAARGEGSHRANQLGGAAGLAAAGTGAALWSRLGRLES